jgi:Domain of unknown function (DUF4383)
MANPVVRPTNRFLGSPVQVGAFLYGIVFLIVGAAGFVPGLTLGMGDMKMAGTGSDATLLGLFQVSVLHNLVHLAYGVVGLLVAVRAVGSQRYLVGGGAVYFLLWIFGIFVVGTGYRGANFIPLNMADNWLHLGLALTMVFFGFLLPRTRFGQNA